MAEHLQALLEQTVCVVTCDGRNLVGTLKGFDQTLNVILEDCHQRKFSPDAPMEEEAQGLCVVRGDNLAVIGEIDEEAFEQLDAGTMRAAPMRPVVH